jgi:hypothetical protein
MIGSLPLSPHGVVELSPHMVKGVFTGLAYIDVDVAAIQGSSISVEDYPYPTIVNHWWTHNDYYPGYDQTMYPPRLNVQESPISVISSGADKGKWMFYGAYPLAPYYNNPFAVTNLGIQPSIGTTGPQYVKGMILGQVAGTVCWYPPIYIPPPGVDVTDGGYYWNQRPDSYKQLTQTNCDRFELLPERDSTRNGDGTSQTVLTAFWPGRVPTDFPWYP